MNREYDVIILGGGVAGLYTAKALSKGGKSVALIERDSLGGTALRWGALPVKRALDYFKEKRGEVERLLHRWEDDLDELNGRLERSISDLDVDIYYGEGEFIDSHTIKVGEKILMGEYIIIATGSDPTGIDGISIDGKMIITHKEAISLKDIPKKIIILGGNVEGIEFASLYAELGVKVVIVEKEDKLLLGYDEDLVEPVEKRLVEKGVEIIKGKAAKRAYIDEGKVRVLVEDGAIIEGDKTLVTLLRKPNFPKGIDRLNIDLDKDRILVDKNLRTKEENIFAIGDINGIMALGNVAINQGLQLAEYILNKRNIDMNYACLPRAVFTLPEIAGIGKQEEDLKGIKYRVGYCDFKESWRGWARGIEEGFIKVIVDENKNILGLWMVGNLVSEYIGLLSPLFNWGLTVDNIKSNLIIHPTLTEGIMEAVLNIR
ncbi:MAG: NAD(P)/FAD-dependent oxidoreductase [Tissierellia bacterium]|nr:NAD(P)/FAD-dependent oxidoreductase [Tissierellia bacterium]